MFAAGAVSLAVVSSLLISGAGVEASPLVARQAGPTSSYSTGYAPTEVTCPTVGSNGFEQWVRHSSGLNSFEEQYLSDLEPSLRAGFQAWLPSNASAVFNFAVNSTSTIPRVAAAFSGGGYRAQLGASGSMSAMDSRIAEAVAAGTGGLSHCLTYMGGLSGGSWFVGSYFANSNATSLDLINNVWNLGSNLIVPDSGFFDTTEYFADMVSEVHGKSSEGFYTQITDYWALALSSHLFPKPYWPTNNPNLTLASLTNSTLYNTSFSQPYLPYPVIISLSRRPGETIVPANATVFEFTPAEFGSWYLDYEDVDGFFTPTAWMGTNLTNGSPTGQCYNGFDNLGFVVGTSSTLFNQIYPTLNSTGDDGVLVSAIELILQGISSDDNDISQITNPFYQYGAGNSSIYNPTLSWPDLDLVDGGESDENVPLEPFVVPAREVDVILAFDNSADTTYSWPNGSEVFNTYERFLYLAGNDSTSNLMPKLPSGNTFVNLGFNSRPTIFGVNETNVPIIIYVGTYPWSAYGNTSTFQLTYETDQAFANHNNAMRSFTLNGTEADWPTCLQCAVVDRARSRSGAVRSSTCESCFNKWAWDGTTTNETSPGEYNPTLGTKPSFLGGGNAIAVGSGSTPTASTSASGPSASASQTSAGLMISVDIFVTMLLATGVVVAICL